MLIDRLNQERHKLSSLGSLMFVAGAVFFAQNIKAPAENIAQEAMELTLTLLEPLLTPPPQPPQPVAPPIRQKVVQPQLQPQPQAPSQPTIKATPEPIRETVAAESPRNIQAPPVTPQTTTPQQAPVPEAPKPVPTTPPTAAVENNYIASVRATLNTNKRYPTGREASLQRPAGKVKVWFILLRNGSLQEAGIDESSNSIILDNAALSTVRRTNYAAWPENSWPNQSTHKFTVTLDFVPLN
jgi:protein TonB